MNIHDATETAFKNGYAQGVKDAAKWISVKDRLPEKYGKYLCRYEFGESEEDPDFKVIWFYSHLGKIVFQGEGCLGMRVTHWMPLPQPPKGE